MLLFDSVVFGLFVGFLADYWMARLGFKKEPSKVVIAVIIATVVAVLVWTHNLNVF